MIKLFLPRIIILIDVLYCLKVINSANSDFIRLGDAVIEILLSNVICALSVVLVLLWGEKNE